jgi:predicted MFS family arabinose efflux permease
MTSSGHSSTLRGWLGVGAISVASFAQVTSEFLPVGILPSIAQGLRVTDGTAGLMVTVPGLVAAVAAPVVAVGAGSVDRRPLLLCLAALVVAANVLAAITTNFLVMMMARALLGFAVGGFWSMAVPAAVRLVAPRSVPIATAIVIGGTSLGTVIGVPVGTYLSEHFGWRMAFAAAAGMAFVGLATQAAVLRSMPSSGAIRPRDLISSLANRQAVAGIVATVFLVSGAFSAYTFVTPFILQALNLSQDLVAPLMLGIGVTGLLGNFLGGWLVGRDPRDSVVALTIVLPLVILLMLLTTQVTPIGVALLLGWGAVFGGIPVILQSWMLASGTGAPEAGQAIFVTVFQTCLALGALAGGQVLNCLGVTATFWLGLVLCLPAVVLFQIVAGRGGRGHPDA